MSKSTRVLQISFVLLLMIAGFFWGGVVGKIRIPAGSGLAGPAIFLGYALTGIIVGLLLGLFFAAKLDGAQLRKGVLIAVILAVIALVAIFLVPKKSIPATAYQPPEPFSPAYVLDFSIVYGSPENPPHTLNLPFNRLRLRAGDRFFIFDIVVRDGSKACSGRTENDEYLRELLTAARAVLSDCEQNPQNCSPESCPDCTPYSLMLIPIEGGEQNRLELSDRYLKTQPAGKELLRMMQIVYEDVKPNMWCN